MSLNIKEKIVRLIEESLIKLQKEGKIQELAISDISVARPENKEFGDYTTNVAMVFAKNVRKNPLELAQALAVEISGDFLDKVEVVKPGFINFFLSQKYLVESLKEILEKDDKYGCWPDRKQKVSVELISANPTGQLHIGHGRGAFFGDTLIKVLRKAGFQTTSFYYVNDAQDSTQIREFGKTALGQGQTYLTEYLQQKINQHKKQLDEFKDCGAAGAYLAGVVQRDIEDFVENRLNIKIDKWVSEEKDLYQTKKVQKLFELLKEKDLIYEKDGALWIKTTNFDEKKDWVVMRQSGQYAYLLPDMAYHQQRFEQYDVVINIWGADHQAQTGKIKAAAKILGYKGKLDFLIAQSVRLQGEKMSKRKGKTITLADLIDEVGLDVTRFMYLKKSLDSQMEFDLNLAKEQSQKNPVYYLQYAYARICSIFRKTEVSFDASHLEMLTESAELNLIRHLLYFDELIKKVAADYQVQHLTQYSLELAAYFHNFYDTCRVLDQDKNLTQARLALVKASQIVLKNVLEILGITAPKKM